MKNIKLKRSEIINFFGLAKASIDLTDGVNIVTAKTGEGKTSLIIGATKFVFGLQINDFQPANNKVLLPKLETKVTQVWEVDGIEYTFIREGKQKWTVDKVTKTESYAGYESSNYTFDGVPTNETNYKKMLSELFGISVAELPLIAVTGYFNNKLDWKERRKWLYQFCKVDELTSELRKSGKYDLISIDLSKGKSTDDINTILTKEKTRIGKSRTENENTIKVRTADLAKYASIDFAKIEAELVKIDKQITSLVTSTNKQNKTELINGKIAEMNRLNSEMQKLIMKDLATKSQYDFDKSNAYRDAMEMANKILRLETDIKDNDEKIIILNGIVAKYTAEQFKDDLICSQCGQSLPQGDIENKKANFEAVKENNINNANEQIQDLLIDYRGYSSLLKTKREEYNRLKSNYELLKNKVVENNSTTINELQAKINEIEKEINSLRMPEVKNEVSDKLDELKTRQSELQKELGKRDLMWEIERQLEILNGEASDLTDEEALNIRKKKQLDDYVMDTINLVNDSINSNFDGGLTFALFKPLTSGAQKEYEEICEAVLDIKGNMVSYSSLSSGEQRQADLLVTKGLQKMLGISMTIIIDDAVLNTLSFNCEQQLIVLETAKNKKLDNAISISIAYKNIIREMSKNKNGGNN